MKVFQKYECIRSRSKKRLWTIVYGSLSTLENNQFQNKVSHSEVDKFLKELDIKASTEKLDCEAFEGGNDDAFFPTHPQLFYDLTRRRRVELRRGQD